jgi:hypothetical protein
LLGWSVVGSGVVLCAVRRLIDLERLIQRLLWLAHRRFAHVGTLLVMWTKRLRRGSVVFTLAPQTMNGISSFVRAR